MHIPFPRRLSKWLVLVASLLFISTLFLVAHDEQRFTRLRLSFWSQVEEEISMVDPFLCNIQHESANVTYTCLGRRPGRLTSAPTRRPAHEPLPSSCIDAHFSAGEPCAPVRASATAPKLDVVWIWANGTDPLFRMAISDAEGNILGPQPAKSRVGSGRGAKLYRDHDELRYSLRSVLQHFSANAGKFHVLTTDVGDGAGNRFGILPQWLDTNTSHNWKDGNVELKIMHHSQVFNDLDNSTFNSFSIESQLYGLSDTSEPFIYMNDDFFFARDLTMTDFYSSAYGIVLRFDPSLLVSAAEWPKDSPSGEWQPLRYSNWLLSERFGGRDRPYMIHVAKTLSPAILQEINEVWSDEFADTASHRFRGQRDAYTTFLHGHYIVERWREILLWSWVIGKIGGDDNSWTADDTARAWEELGGTEGFDTTRTFLKMRRTLETMRVLNAFQQSSEPIPAATKLLYSSLDGYPYAYIYEKPKEWPQVAQGIDSNVNGVAPDWGKKHWSRCTISRKECFLPEAKSATEIFNTIAFDRVYSCGDCIIQSLVTRSGNLGLDAFLPPPHRIHYSNAKGRVVEEVDPNTAPRLPLTKRPKDASFAARDVLREWGTIRVRDWVLRAMERYRFVIGDTPAHFGMLSSPKGATRFFQQIDDNKDLALLTINDDVVMRADEVDRVFRIFLERRWSFPSAWEDRVLDPAA